MTSERALKKARLIDPEATEFVVRLYDGFDGEWMDVTKPLSAEEAMKDWNKRTDEGKRATSYGDIDYYAIFPSTVTMVWSEKGLGAQNR
jgi:hypothetical protein